jgi:hypothetical protein
MRQGVISIERYRSLKFNLRLGQPVLDKPQEPHSRVGLRLGPS